MIQKGTPWRINSLFKIMCLMLLIQSAMLVTSFGASDHGSSFPSEVGRGIMNADCKSDQTTSSLPCSQRYLMESYFEKHGSLLDADFQDFLAHELPLDSCKVLPLDVSSILITSMLHRHLTGEGSHRHLISSIKINNQRGAISELPSHSCKAIIIERLPSGVFTDPFELQHLVERGVFMDAAVFGDTNLELPSALSNESVVEVHMNIGHNMLSTHWEGMEVNIELPLHARYPPLDGSGYSTIQMDLPYLFIHCSIKENLQHQNCLWMSANEGSEFSTSIVWRMPSGKSGHAKFVSAITYISALLSTLSIVVTSIYCSLIELSGAPMLHQLGSNRRRPYQITMTEQTISIPCSHSLYLEPRHMHRYVHWHQSSDLNSRITDANKFPSTESVENETRLLSQQTQLISMLRQNH